MSWFTGLSHQKIIRFKVRALGSIKLVASSFGNSYDNQSENAISGSNQSENAIIVTSRISYKQ
jgi:hypothetical protein